VPGATTTPVGPELTLQECITRALNKNFDLEIGHFGPQIAKSSIESAQGGFDPVLTLSGSHGKSTTGNSSVTSGTDATNSDLRVGVTQQLYSGTTLSASSQLDRARLNPATIVGALNPAYNADVTLSVRQSLLAGLNPEVNKAAINRARIGLDVANLNYKAQALTVILNTETAYYNLAFAQEQLVVFNTSLALAQRLYEEAKTRRDTGVATDLDVLQAEVGVANARRNVILAGQTVKDRQDALLALIGQFELDHAVGPVHFPEVSPAVPVFASSLQAAKDNQPDFLAAKTAIDQYKLDTLVAKDAIKPDLTVGAALGFSGRNGTGTDAYGDAIDRQNNSWQVDFSFIYPLGQRTYKARYQQSLFTLNREQVRLRQLEQSIEVQVRSAVRSVETNLESVKIAALSSELSQRQYDLEEARFKAGVSTSYRVLQAQTDLDTARVNELQAKVSLNNAISALHRVEGSSLQRYAVQQP
jgi:outer membrane protein TolC